MRRIVTQNDSDGRSHVLAISTEQPGIRAEAGALMDLWKTGAAPPPLTADPSYQPVLEPPPGGSLFRFFEIPPRGVLEKLPPEVVEQAASEAFERIGAAHTRVDTARHPLMHKTATIDYIILLQGRVRLLLDSDEAELEPFDVVIQQGTNHAWVNIGDKPALLAAILLSQPD